MSYFNHLRAVLANQGGLLLDQYPGAAAAYSLRYLSSSYTGDVILVRRSSDDAEQGFTPSDITDGTLESFCGMGDGFVKTWYDQSGNSRDAFNNDTARQPIIVSSGSLILYSGKPYIYTANTRSFIHNNAAGLFRNVSFVGSINVVNKRSSNPFGELHRIDNSDNRATYIFRDRSGAWELGGRRLESDAFQAVSTGNTNTLKIVSGFLDVGNASAYIYINKDLATSTDAFQTAGNTEDTAKQSNQFLSESSYIESSFFRGDISESILFDQSILNEYTDIVDNINNYYSIL